MLNNSNNEVNYIHAFSFSDNLGKASKENEHTQFICDFVRKKQKSELTKSILLFPVFLSLSIIFLLTIIYIIFLSSWEDDSIFYILGALLMLVFSAPISWSLLDNIIKQRKISKYPLETEPLKNTLMSGITCSDMYKTLFHAKKRVVELCIGEKCVLHSKNIVNAFLLDDVSKITVCPYQSFYYSLTFENKNGQKITETIHNQEYGSRNDTEETLIRFVHEMVSLCPNAEISITINKR